MKTLLLTGVLDLLRVGPYRAAAASISANLPATEAAAVDRRNRQTDGWTLKQALSDSIEFISAVQINLSI